MNANQTLYLKIGQDTVVTDRHVKLSDIAKMECTDKALLRQLKQKKIYSFSDIDTSKRENTLVVFSVLKIIELIHEEYPLLIVDNEGEKDFIVEYKGKPAKSVWISRGKTVLLCILIFFGAAFTIMAFNNDVGVSDIFAKFYYQVTGTKSDGFTEIEICYCIGLSVGILVFFNHVGRKKLTSDPTPIQIEMCKYESDLFDALIENSGKRGHSIDVD